MNSIKPYIVYEDDQLMVINKPKGLIVHPTAYVTDNTLVELIKGAIDLATFIDPSRPGIVHRLDQYTNGLMVVAKNQQTLEELQNQIADGILVRKYRAIVHHQFEDDNLIIKAPIARSKGTKLKFVVSDETKAKEAITKIHVIKNFNHAALIECVLETGRTHQIRVHMQYIHHPIFNDPVYGHDDGYPDYHQFLYSAYLKLVHPITKKVMEFSIEPDKTFNSLLKELENGK